MPSISLNLPNNSRFFSSMNEIDSCMGEIFLTEMRLADPRDKSHRQNSTVLEGNDNWLWDRERIFQVDEMTTEDIFDTWLLRHSKINKNIDVTYPLLAYKQNDLKDVFWGTGNRYREWYITAQREDCQIEEGDAVVIKDRTRPNLFGTRATVYKKLPDDCFGLYYQGTTNKIVDKDNKLIAFPDYTLGQLGNKAPQTFKAKAITGTYSAVILVDNRDEAQYIRDRFILRCNDANIWFTYKSPILNDVENQIYTVFEIPVLERYPAATEKLKGKGYIYGVGIDVNIWATLTDVPLQNDIIEMIRENITIIDQKSRNNLDSSGNITLDNKAIKITITK